MLLARAGEALGGDFGFVPLSEIKKGLLRVQRVLCDAWW